MMRDPVSLRAGAALIVLLTLVGCGAPKALPLPGVPAAVPEPTPTQGVVGDPSVLRSPHVPFGIPVDGDPSDDLLMNKGAYVLSHNPYRHVANWVGWRVGAEDLGDAQRRNDFRSDLALPDTYYRVVLKDYVGSGFERGHLCPSADRTRSAEENSITFLLTNVHPQVSELNRGPWKSLETHTRRLVGQGRHAYVVAGALFGDRTIGNGVSVPLASYKIIVVLEAGQRPSDVTLDNEVLAVIMPNDPSVRGKKWSSFLVSVDEVEARSGYDFLHGMDDGVEALLEEKRAPAE